MYEDKEINSKKKELIAEDKLQSEQIIYDGKNASKVTVYKKGTLYSNIKPEHKKILGIK